MIEIKEKFSKNELAFINIINESLTDKYVAEGAVTARGEFVRYEVYIGNPIEKNLFILQFSVRDNEDTENGGCNFVYISNIMVPRQYQRKGIAAEIITVMSFVAYKKLGIALFITRIVNDEWKESLLRMGGVEDADGDIEIIHEDWMVQFIIHMKEKTL